MSALYREKCDKCGIERPEYFIQVNKTKSGSWETEFWCIDCIGGKLVESSE